MEATAEHLPAPLPTEEQRQRWASRGAINQECIELLRLFECNGMRLSNRGMETHFGWNGRTKGDRIDKLRGWLADISAWNIPRPEKDHSDSYLYWYRLTSDPTHFLRNMVARGLDAASRAKGIHGDLVSLRKQNPSKEVLALAATIAEPSLVAVESLCLSARQASRAGIDLDEIKHSLTPPTSEDELALARPLPEQLRACSMQARATVKQLLGD